MSIGTRAATCASCSKRLTRKQWYYRNGQYFCKKRCWVKEDAKAKAEASEKKKAEAEKGAGQVKEAAASS